MLEKVGATAESKNICTPFYGLVYDKLESERGLLTHIFVFFIFFFLLYFFIEKPICRKKGKKSAGWSPGAVEEIVKSWGKGY